MPAKFIFTALIALMLTACSESGQDQTLTTPSAAEILASLQSDSDPESTMYQTLSGQALDLNVFAGKKVFVNYWATWCAPCIREIPSINRAAEALESENYVFVLASDESQETIAEFLEERQFEGNFIKLNDYFGAHGIHAVPSSLLLDEKGEVIRRWDGSFEWDSPEMLAQLRVQD